MKTISRRKKIAIAVFAAVLLLLIALFILIGGRDQITEITEESGSMDNTDYQWINHRFEKGNALSLNISASKTALGDGSYQLMIIVNQENNTDYQIASMNASLSSSAETQFRGAIVGKDGGEYGVPDVGYDGNTKIQRFTGDNYLYYSAIVTDSDPIPEMELTLRYRIEGKNRYFLNKFYNNTATLPIRFSNPPQENEETNPVTDEEEDRLTDTVEEEFTGGKVHFGRIVCHSFEKGAELNLNVGVSRDKIDENTYRLTIIFDRDENEDYEVEDLNAILRSDRHGVTFVNAFVSGRDDAFSSPSESFSGNVREQSFRGGNGYFYYTAILQGNSEMTLEVRYRIQGKNRYRCNVFSGNTVTVPIDRFPESAEPDPKQEIEEPNPVTNDEEDEVVAISDTSIKTIAETLADDYFVADDGIGVYYSNVSDEPSWQGYTFTKGEFFGEILYSTEELELSKIEPWSANVLPIGTKLYRANENKTVVLAETDGTLIPYLKIVEG